MNEQRIYGTRKICNKCNSFKKFIILNTCECKKFDKIKSDKKGK